MNLKAISNTHVLFPVFAGLFGISTILDSLKARRVRIAQKKYSTVKVDGKIIEASALGAVSSVIVGC